MTKKDSFLSIFLIQNILYVSISPPFSLQLNKTIFFNRFQANFIQLIINSC